MRRPHRETGTKHNSFPYLGQRVPLANLQRGTFKLQQIRFLLPIKTVFPKPGRSVWYIDHRDVHRQFSKVTIPLITPSWGKTRVRHSGEVTPRWEKDPPDRDRDRLALRFERFKAAV